MIATNKTKSALADGDDDADDEDAADVVAAAAAAVVDDDLGWERAMAMEWEVLERDWRRIVCWE